MGLFMYDPDFTDTIPTAPAPLQHRSGLIRRKRPPSYSLVAVVLVIAMAATVILATFN
jgi:hypothetical protein